MVIEITHLVEKMQSKKIENIHTTTNSAKLKPRHYKTIHTQQTFKHYTTSIHIVYYFIWDRTPTCSCTISIHQHLRLITKISYLLRGVKQTDWMHY